MTKFSNISIKTIVVAVVSAFIISVVCYLMNNCPYPYWDRLENVSKLEYLLRNIVPLHDDREDAFFINVSYDRQLVDYTYSEGMLTGKIDITNRQTLLEFLKAAERTNTYKYIFLDIRFEKGMETETDLSLFAQIRKMRDISFSIHSDIEILDSALIPKTGINDYFTTIISTNFTRYQFLQNGHESVPLRIYKATNPEHKTITQWGPLFFCGNNLCQNSPFMNIPVSFYEGHDEEGHQCYFDLGPYLLDEFNDKDWSVNMKDKIVIVGDFVNDLHDTYTGLQPGSYLVYLAYKELVNGKHLVSWFFVGIMFVIYFAITIAILCDISIRDIIPMRKIADNAIIRFILGLISYTTLLSLITIIMYVCFDVTYNIVFPALFFSILNFFRTKISESR